MDLLSNFPSVFLGTIVLLVTFKKDLLSSKKYLEGRIDDSYLEDEKKELTMERFLDLHALVHQQIKKRRQILTIFYSLLAMVLISFLGCLISCIRYFQLGEWELYFNKYLWTFFWLFCAVFVYNLLVVYSGYIKSWISNEPVRG